MGEIHVELNFATKTVNQVIATSQRTNKIKFDDAHQGDMSNEIQGERIGRSNSEAQVEYYFES